MHFFVFYRCTDAGCLYIIFRRKYQKGKLCVSHSLFCSFDLKKRNKRDDTNKMRNADRKNNKLYFKLWIITEQSCRLTSTTNLKR